MTLKTKPATARALQATVIPPPDSIREQLAYHTRQVRLLRRQLKLSLAAAMAAPGQQATANIAGGRHAE